MSTLVKDNENKLHNVNALGFFIVGTMRALYFQANRAVMAHEDWCLFNDVAIPSLHAHPTVYGLKLFCDSRPRYNKRILPDEWIVQA